MTLFHHLESLYPEPDIRHPRIHIPPIIYKGGF